MDNMTSITGEIKAMMDPDAADTGGEEEAPDRFGAKDASDLTTRNLMDAYSCTECGRCTAACPANQTGKLLSPRKIMMDTRDRIAEIGEGKEKEGENFNDGKSLLGDFITKEELWACTTCQACVEECPVGINPLDIIYQLRRYMILEEADTPEAWTQMLTSVENNGAPWQLSPDDRFKWAEEFRAS
ncbi:MAG: Fe-S oxidoreductase, partial [Bacteroidetes bacterium SW_11_45_7]